MKTLFIPLEIKTRELDSKLLIALKLLSLSNDWKVIFGYYKKVGDYWRTKNIKNFVLLETGLDKDEERYLKIYKKNSFAIILDEEGGVFAKSQISFPRGGFENNCIKYLEKIFVWGPQEKKLWKLRHKNIDPNKIIISGNPRFELCKTNYFKYFNKINSINYSNYILVSFAFGTGNSIIDQNIEIEYWAKRKGTENIRQKILPLRIYQEKLLPLYMQGIKELVSKLKGENFIIRAHPIENIQLYKKNFINDLNVQIIENSSIQDYLPKAKLLIHNGCTTAIESFYAGKIPICFLPEILDEENQAQILTLNISKIVRKADELITLVKNITSNNPIIEFKKNQDTYTFLEKHISNLKFSSSNKIANEINNINFNKKRNLHFSFKLRLINNLPIKLRQIIGFIKYNFNFKKLNQVSNNENNDNFSKRDKIKFPYLEKNEILKRVAAFKIIDNKIPNIIVKKIDKNLYILEK